MENPLRNSKVAIVGAGKFGTAFLKLTSRNHLAHLNIQVIGIADINPAAEGMGWAKKHGVFTTVDYLDLFQLKNIDTIIELTGYQSVIESIENEKLDSIRFIDHYDATLIFDLLQIESERIKQIDELRNHSGKNRKIEQQFINFSQNLGKILEKRTTAFKRLEKELMSREMVLAQIIDRNTIPTFIIDKDHFITHWNRAMEKLSGYPAEKVVGKRKQWEPFWENERSTMADAILDQIPEEEIRALYGNKWQRSALIKDAYEAEVFFPKLGEKGKWCYFTAAPIKAPDGNIIGAIETLWDTTEQKLAKEKLKKYTNNLEEMVRESTEEIGRKSDFQQKLISSSNDGIIATDQNGYVVIYNRGAERIFGFKNQEVVNVLKIDQLYPDSAANAVLAGLNMENGVDLSEWREVNIVAKNEEIIPTRFSGSILYQEQEVIGSVCFFRDLRKIKQLQKDLVQSERLAAIGQTIAGLSHYVKNILHGLKGGVYVLNKALDKDDTDKVKSGWDIIERNVGRISDLVMDLLTYSKEREPEPENCFPNKLVKEVFVLLATKAEENDIEIKLALDPRLDEVYLDPQVIHRALLNLISNAIDACLFDPDSKTPWWVHVSTTLESDNIIKFEVSDNGMGMSQETANMLFSQLFSDKGQQGTGLGLLVTGKIVKENGGTIAVTSESGKGATFTIRLPFEKAKNLSDAQPHL